MRLAVLAVLASCAHAATPAREPPAPRSRETRYTIWFGGARIGTAIEHETWSAAGVVLRREETMRFLRGTATVAITTTIEITADRALVPACVAWSEHQAGRPERRATAVHEHGGWFARPACAAPAAALRAFDDEPAASSGDRLGLAGDAIPAELVPLVTRRDGRFAGRVFLPARGFLAGSGRIEPIAFGRLVARLALDGGAVVEATIDAGADGTYTRVVDGDGVIAIRATAERAAAAFEPVDLIAAAAIPIHGERGRWLVVDASVAFPPVPGQLARRDPDGGIALELSPLLPGDLPVYAPTRDRTREIALIVAQVRARVAPDLGAPGSPRDAGSATAGDCTTFALAYAALAGRRGITTRVVTGLRVDGDRLVRHRWAVSWTGRAWIAVDAAYGAVPAGGNLIGLAVHGADDAGLVAGEAALTQIRSATWR